MVCETKVVHASAKVYHVLPLIVLASSISQLGCEPRSEVASHGHPCILEQPWIWLGSGETSGRDGYWIPISQTSNGYNALQKSWVLSMTWTTGLANFTPSIAESFFRRSRRPFMFFTVPACFFFHRLIINEPKAWTTHPLKSSSQKKWTKGKAFRELCLNASERAVISRRKL